VVDSDINAAWMYNYAPIIVIYRWEGFLGLRLKVLILSRSFVEDTDV